LDDITGQITGGIKFLAGGFPELPPFTLAPPDDLPMESCKMLLGRALMAKQSTEHTLGDNGSKEARLLVWFV
jgi:hypothetical protein